MSFPSFIFTHQEHIMRTTTNKPDPGAQGPNMQHEADVGSGERSPAQQETDQMIKEIPTRGDQKDAGQSGQDDSSKP
jgi:hypothetical protein